MDTGSSTTIPSFFRYWGKASSDSEAGPSFHLLPYHCLDVAAVAAVWWDRSPVIRRRFVQASGRPEEQIRAWTLFFIALHDLGKLDIRFQLKAESAFRALNPCVQPSDTLLTPSLLRGYRHGPAGLYWLTQELEELLNGPVEQLPNDDPFDFFDTLGEEEEQVGKTWYEWLEAVTGHHGHVVASTNNAEAPLPRECPKALARQDKDARFAWIHCCADLFLKPVGLGLQDDAPTPSPLLAGFCSVADWLGSASSEQRFRYVDQPLELLQYFQNRMAEDAPQALAAAGLLGGVNAYAGIQTLLKQGHAPRQLQVLVDTLPQQAGLTLVEAPTGAGKTETALAYAWRLLDQGLADRIVFALPTQATANAMLERLERLATKLFGSPELVLAHGNARFNERFAELRARGETVQAPEEAWAECSAWLAQSGKRAFLGQIGVCTIDQVLVSVLPVKHRFIRGFGLGQSVLIVDEVHAYDAYMYGLLKHVLKAQKEAGGSALLLSATLPEYQRRALVEAWGVPTDAVEDPAELPYPLVTCCHERVEPFDLESLADQKPPSRRVYLEPYRTCDMQADEALLQQVCDAAEQGANIALVVNLVADAQNLACRLAKMTDKTVRLFHARYTLKDRQVIEADVLQRFNDEAKERGQILVATQVVEQSLDVDFDWMITQLCPADLLFQRLGRLHRHPHKNADRPQAFQEPRCTVLLPEGEDYGVHGKIYADVRVLWRTQQKINELAGKPLAFPAAYRQWIELVYAEAPWGSEPEAIEKGYREYADKIVEVQRMGAEMMVRSAMKPLPDEDDKVRAVTRDGEMSLFLVPCIESTSGCQLLDGACWESLDKWQRPEALAMNSVAVPGSWWHGWLEKHFPDTGDGPLWLPMRVRKENWVVELGRWRLRYSKELGMERIDGSVNG